jgi:hypothetical protein
MDGNKLVHLWSRVYADFFMPSRLDAYRDFVREVLTHGYEICSIALFWERIKCGQVSSKKKYLVLRHDVDTDLTATKLMWRLEKQFNVTSSYYFRLTTLDIPLMREIQQCGGEASYHFEELATVAKKMRLKTQAQVMREMTSIRESFRNNLNLLRGTTGLPITIVASHGDFVNRKLGMGNWEILSDVEFRRDVGVELEVYDEMFNRHISSRYADTSVPPSVWKPEPPFGALRAGMPVIYVLVHPGTWRASAAENLHHVVKRVWEGLHYSF